ncbi:hypothetical protein QPK87_18885 [Kamptonema cortianum]|nr:hypothetical protein [Geitlerinema splendidum]MDK3158621.1 hypothetical protein [Kamptonema cortianum]
MFSTLLLGVSAALSSPPQSVELTVYNGGFALVKEQRELNLQSGIQTVGIEDVAELIEANSVGIRSISRPGSFVVLEQSYQFDLISPMAILNKAVGKRIVFNRTLPNGQKERIEGTLMSAPTAMVSDGSGNLQGTWNGMVIKTDDGRIILNPYGEIEVASIPDGLISKPTLVWMLNSANSGMNKIELSYLTQGMSWKADYVLSLDGDGGKGDLKGWVTLTNHSGATYNAATLKLLAGDVRRAQPQGLGGARGGAPMEMAKAADDMRQEQFADYHLYTLQRPTDVRNKEIKQVSLLEAVNVPVQKRLIVDAMRMYRNYRPNQGEVGTGIIKPLIQIELTNDKASNLGMPFPAGNFKVFQRDSGGSLQMLGEDSIDHTPKEEKIKLIVGSAFDVVVERKRTEFNWIGEANLRRGVIETFEIELRNRKETAETVHVYERHWGQHRITKTSLEPKKLDSETYEFVVPLKAGEVKKVTYTIETRW